MADQREITLHQGDATPKDIVLRDLPVASVASLTVWMFAGDSTPRDIVLRDPTETPSAGGTTIVPVDLASSGVAGGSLVGACLYLSEFSANGAAGGSMVGAAVFPAVLTASGTASDAIAAAAIAASVLGASGASTVAFDGEDAAGGATIIAADMGADGSSAVDFVGQEIIGFGTFAGFWGARPRKRERIEEDAAIEAAEVIQRIATKARDRDRAQKLEIAILAASTRAQYAALESRVRWAKQRAEQLRRKDDDDIAAVLLLIE